MSFAFRFNRGLLLARPARFIVGVLAALAILFVARQPGGGHKQAPTELTPVAPVEPASTPIAEDSIAAVPAGLLPASVAPAAPRPGAARPAARPAQPLPPNQLTPAVLAQRRASNHHANKVYAALLVQIFGDTLTLAN